MRIAIPVNEDRGMDSGVAPHFGHVPLMAVYDTEKCDIEMIGVKPTDGCSPIESLSGKRVDAVYALGMGMKAMERCRLMKVRIMTGSFMTVEDVIRNIDRLEELDESCGH